VAVSLYITLSAIHIQTLAGQKTLPGASWNFVHAPFGSHKERGESVRRAVMRQQPCMLSS
jgi:hypothetical protein